MFIGSPQITLQNDRALYSVPVSIDDDPRPEKENLWFSVPAKYGELLAPTADAALAGLLLPAMRRGGTLNVEGTVSPRLLYHLQEPLQNILKFVVSGTRHLQIQATNLRTDAVRPQGVAGGFSAGIDSYAMLYTHYYAEDIPNTLKLTHLTFHNVGSHLRPSGHAQTHAVFEQRFDRTARVAEQIGLPLIPVDSNLDYFYDDPASAWSFGFRRTHTIRNVAAALVLQGGIGRFLFASGHHSHEVKIVPHLPAAYMEPVTIPMMMTETLDTIPTEHHLTRSEKTVLVAAIENSYTTLDVCITPDQAYNCSICEKCLRTLLTLEIIGKIEYYAPVFDLDAYWRARPKAIRQLLLKRHMPFNRDIIQLAKKRQYPLFSTSRPSGWGNGLWWMANWGYRIGKPLKDALWADG